MTYFAFVRKERRLLTFAISFTFFSSFGQTFLLSLFVPYFLTTFELSNASFGTLYSLATLTGAIALPYLGQYIDRIPLRNYSMYVAGGLFLAAVMMAISWHVAILFIALIFLRLAGQGLSGHTAQATMARIYDKNRGKALSISAIGYPIGEAILPSLIAFMMVYMHWRTVWGFVAGLIALFFIPFLWALIKNESTTVEGSEEEVGSTKENYSKIFHDYRTYYTIPAILIPPFWVTGLFLYQVSAADDMGWTAAIVASAFVAFAVSRIVAGLISGPMIDRFSAQSLFPFLLLPMVIGLAIAIFFSGTWTAFVYMGFVGVTLGLSSTFKSSLWAELYGTRMIGTVQSLFAFIMVFSTAMSPFLMGWMLDNNFTLTSIFVIALSTGLFSTLLSCRLLFKSKEFPFLHKSL
ncbi:MFS transporter [Rhodohalobacter halophilus]|uniref:MFS transporter n=1 Tax=Rhodohalobacter halophilus TaxID=1812810 RepID=UPI00083F8F69|nr:MFS transporter [Rhodohalobacter halophilus]